MHTYMHRWIKEIAKVLWWLYPIQWRRKQEKVEEVKIESVECYTCYKYIANYKASYVVIGSVRNTLSMHRILPLGNLRACTLRKF